MATLLAILFWLLVAAVAAILLVVAMPLRLELELAREEALRFSAVLRPLGRFGPGIPLSGGDKSTEKPAKAKRKPKRRHKRWSVKPQRAVQAGLRLLAELFDKVRFETAQINLRFGFGDPGETGQVYGQMVPLIHMASSMPHVDVAIEPDFERATLTGNAGLALSLIPATLLPPLVRFGWAVFGPSR